MSTLAERIEAGTNRRGPDECWPWRAQRIRYGKVRVPEEGNRQVDAHVAAWVVANGRWPVKGEVVRHSCDYPPCVNPAHLLIGSQSDNQWDRREREVPRTHCVNNHEYTEETVYMLNGARYCRKCAVENSRRYRRKANL